LEKNNKINRQIKGSHTPFALLVLVIAVTVVFGTITTMPVSPHAAFATKTALLQQQEDNESSGGSNADNNKKNSDSFGSSHTDTNTISGLSNYNNHSLGISLQYPSNWKLKESLPGDTNGVSFQQFDGNGNWVQSVMIYAHAPGEILAYPSMDTPRRNVVEDLIRDFHSKLPDFKLLRQGKGPTIGGNPSVLILFTYTSTNSGSIDTVAYLIKNHEKLVLIEYLTKHGELQKHISDLSTILSSLKIMDANGRNGDNNNNSGVNFDNNSDESITASSSSDNPNQSDTFVDNSNSSDDGNTDNNNNESDSQ
jgi:hypothetical protein